MGIVRKLIYLFIFFLFTGSFFVQKVNAASLVNVSDTLTTSRPSAAAPLSAAVAASAGQAQIVDNGSIFLASDSAVIYRDAANESSDVNLNIASMSATGVPSATNRIVYFTNSTSFAHHQGVALISNVTATHQIKFTTVSTIPSGGKIILTFPGSGSNSASPSATGFSFNGMTTTNPTDVKCFPTTACNSGSSISVTGSNTITFTTSGSIAGGTVIYANIGCTTAASGPCTVFAPRLINPTKTAAAGTADSWKISIQTQDNSLVNLDYGSLRAATIDSVQVQATVEPTITFTITGRTSADTNWAAISGISGCGVDTQNTGIDATATTVNLGLLNNGVYNRAAQSLAVSTNGSSGYAITATSSGTLMNPASGFSIPDANGGTGLTANDTPNPKPFPTSSGSAAMFGISPCGARVPTSVWGPSGMISYNSNFSNPWNTGSNGYSATIASYTGGPISNDTTLVRYQAGITGTTPAGIYLTDISYVATATF